MTIAKQYLYALDGSVTAVDTRVFADCVVFQLACARTRASEVIFAVAPPHTQSNAALGLLSSDESVELRQHIWRTREHYAVLKARILSVTWDGNEASRAHACDCVMACCWE